MTRPLYNTKRKRKQTRVIWTEWFNILFLYISQYIDWFRINIFVICCCLSVWVLFIYQLYPYRTVYNQKPRRRIRVQIMTQFLEIINLLSNPTAILPNSEQQKVNFLGLLVSRVFCLIISLYFKLIQEFERLKESDNGWKDCIQLITSDQNL